MYTEEEKQKYEKFFLVLDYYSKQAGFECSVIDSGRRNICVITKDNATATITNTMFGDEYQELPMILVDNITVPVEHRGEGKFKQLLVELISLAEVLKIPLLVNSEVNQGFNQRRMNKLLGLILEPTGQDNLFYICDDSCDDDYKLLLTSKKGKVL